MQQSIQGKGLQPLLGIWQKKQSASSKRKDISISRRSQEKVLSDLQIQLFFNL